MASEQPSQRKSPDPQKEPKGSRPGSAPAPHSGPPLLNDGPELVRDNNC